jgi:hypothetical protein
MSTSTTTTEPSVEEVERYNTDALITEKNLEINESEFQSLRNKGVAGKIFLELNNELFISDSIPIQLTNLSSVQNLCIFNSLGK